MGNCMETCRINTNLREENGEVKEENSKGMEISKDEGNFVKDVVNSKNGLRVKMVLTKEELQWLMLQLSNREGGGKRIEDVLVEIDKGRTKKVVGGDIWRPSLESITEIPEVVEMIR